MGGQEGKPRLRVRILEGGDRLWHWLWWLCAVACLQKHLLVRLDAADSREPCLGRGRPFLLLFLTSPYCFETPLGHTARPPILSHPICPVGT